MPAMDDQYAEAIRNYYDPSQQLNAPHRGVLPGRQDWVRLLGDNNHINIPLGDHLARLMSRGEDGETVEKDSQEHLELERHGFTFTGTGGQLKLDPFTPTQEQQRIAFSAWAASIGMSEGSIGMNAGRRQDRGEGRQNQTWDAVYGTSLSRGRH
ncbi:hypothetical protein [Streptomyces sp. NPDC058394]|uniref:hypothetical protein n=1 Tax=Streptomyces sp. NPDC058394 TaxID=3346477 RepID=UPI0036662437